MAERLMFLLTKATPMPDAMFFSIQRMLDIVEDQLTEKAQDEVAKEMPTEMACRVSSHGEFAMCEVCRTRINNAIATKIATYELEMVGKLLSL